MLKPLVTDDGFESFNGNGTSNSDNNESLLDDKHNNKRQMLCTNRQNNKIKFIGTSSDDEEGSNSDTDVIKKPKIMVRFN